MPCRIVTKYGSVSDTSYKLGSRYVRVGTDGENELIVYEKRLPPTLFILEATSERKVWRLHSRCSNLVLYNGTTLDEDQIVDWRVGETIIIGGLVEFELIYESSRRMSETPSVPKTKGDQINAKSDSSYAPTKNSKTQEKSSPNRSTKNVKSFNAKQAAQLGVIALCGIALGVLLLTPAKQSVLQPVSPTVINNELALGFCSDDKTMETFCTNGILNERRNREAARSNFRRLEVCVRTSYENEGKKLDDVKKFTLSDGTSRQVTYRDFFEYLNVKLSNN